MTVPRSRALVTGARGFVGARLCRRLLADRWIVEGVVRRAPADAGHGTNSGLSGAIPLWSADDSRSLAERLGAFRPDVVFNLAAKSQVEEALRQPIATFEANVAWVWRLLDAVRMLTPPPVVVHVSSEAVYGPSDGHPSLESDELRPRGHYAVSKAASELVARSFSETHGIPIVIARLGNVYGSGDPNHARLIPDILKHFRVGAPPRLREGRSKRGYLHVEDAVDALIGLASYAPKAGLACECFNVAAEQTHSSLEVAELAREAFGRPDVDILVADVAGSSNQSASTEKIKDAIGWHPKIALAAGLRAMVAEENGGDGSSEFA
jgi:CDP-glucose 4,6-dehydratase